jgi:prepilin-type N-terminal cleavage/methylation domain-containing protein
MSRAVSPQRGFTLMELTVVLVIVALLIGGLMVPLSTQQDIRGRQDTEKALSEIREALIGFAVVNGRLPCPADPALPTPTGTTCPSASGCEVTSGSGHAMTCTNNPGVLPWATLGLPETNAWGHRYTYRVSQVFARGIDAAPTTSSLFNPGCASLTAVADMPTRAAFALCTEGDMSIFTTTAGTAISSKIPAVVVSHGKNAVGGWLPLGNQVAGASGDELTNATAGTNLVSNTTIDDQLVWLSPHLLMNRMIAAGKLP